MLMAFMTLISAAGAAAVIYFIMDGPRRRYLHAADRLDERERRVENDEAAIEAAAERNRAAAERTRVAAATVASENAALVAARGEFDGRAVKYADLQAENAVLKGHLRHAGTDAARQEYELGRLATRLTVATRTADDLGREYLQQAAETLTRSLTPSNYAAVLVKLRKSVARTAALGYALPTDAEEAMVGQLQAAYAGVARAAQARDEQARIQAKIREDAQRERDIQKAIEEATREREVVEVALARALADAGGKHAAEVERLREMLAAAEAKSQRAVSMAQQTKRGNVYVISNVGSFGEGVFKVGMTRRLDPQDRVDELSSAPVPFPFDVHLMIPSDDAPALEHAMHKSLHRQRVNKANPRKEFFRVSLADIQNAATEAGADLTDVTFVEVPEAEQYHASLAMTDAEQDFIESVVSDGEDE
jgi:hypothetical protein